jgi:hypothetical protein
VYSFPGVSGEVVRDMGSGSNVYMLEFIFDGKDNDKNSRAFQYAIRTEKGQWEISHPVHGFLGLTPAFVSVMDDVVDSGGATRITSEWIEDIDEETEQTAREMAGAIDKLSTGTGIEALDTFLNAVNTAKTTLTKTLALTSMAISNASELALSPLAAMHDLVYETQMATHRAMNDILNATVLAPAEMGAKMQELITNPALAIEDINARMDYYDSLYDELDKTLPGEINSQIPSYATALQKKNSMLTTELAMNAVTQARSTIAITGPLKSRKHALDVAARIYSGHKAIQDRLEGLQELTANRPLEQQYFANMAQSSTSNLVGQTLRYLFKIIYDLKVEKRITLKRWMTPIDITVQEYGSLGKDESYLDLFIESNELQNHLEDIVLMPPGREVLIYV